MINISDQIDGTNFRWSEALWLPKWELYTYPKADIVNNIKSTAKKLQLVRNHYNKPIRVTSWYRPEIYNQLIKGAPNSYHVKGLAVDFEVDGISCDQVRKDLEHRLGGWSIRMENLPNSAWIHLDLGNPADHYSSRFFRPLR